MKKHLGLFLATIAGLILCPAVQAETLTYADLVGQLTDLSRLATAPPPGERGAQASSYDRASQYDAKHDKYIHWDANGDNNGIVRREGDLSVLADIQGPGCIRRIWSAAPGKGHVRIYLDGAKSPAVDLPFNDYFNGKNAPFTRPNLVYTTAALGFDNYTPISFQKSCKVVADKDWGAYYHFTYTQFAPGTTVPTFSMNLSKEDNEALDAADHTLDLCGQDPAGSRPGEQTLSNTVTVTPGSTVTAAELDGPQAITALKVHLDLPHDLKTQRTFLRQLTLRITWDDDAEPAVWSPLGDFFASPAGAIPFQALPVGLTKDRTFYCYWYMPFATKARIALGNDGPDPVSIQLEVVHAPLTLPIDSLSPLPRQMARVTLSCPQRLDRAPDWNILTTQGRGRFVGVALHVWNPRGGWWGEGDEKFFVDGEKFPSTFGTGSEDYFGFAWCNPHRFAKPFHDQPINENNSGHSSEDRWEIVENIPFQQSFEGCIEKYFPNKRPTLYAAVAYWYLAPGGQDRYEAVPVGERVGYWVRPPAFHVDDVIEAENMPVLNTPEHMPASQYMSVFKALTWSNEQQLFWTPKADGEKLVVGFKAPQAGRFHLLARFTKAPDYGTIQVGLDEQEDWPARSICMLRTSPPRMPRTWASSISPPRTTP